MTELPRIAACLLLWGFVVNAAPPRPNVLVIISDEHNAGIMGCAGDPIARTPHLDDLAARGVLFSAHYCASPICTPSRQSLTTGKYVSRHNVWGNTVGVPNDWPSLPRVFTAAGYESFLIGKMHYKGGRDYGFTVLDQGKAGGRAAGSPAESVKKPSPRPRERLPAGLFPDRGNEIGAEFTPLGEVDDLDTFVDVRRRDDAVAFLRARPPDARPFFLVVGFITPHYPLVAPPEFLAHFKDRVPPPVVPAGYVDTLPLNYRHLRNDRKLERVPPETVKLAREAYYARVEWADEQIGQVLSALAASDCASNTVVVYTSDHGENLGEHGLWWKNCLYDSGARVPLIVSWPARWNGGQVRAGACGALDLVQTLADVAGAKTPPDWNGRSMGPWLDDPDFAWRDLAVSEYYSGYIASGMAMVRQGDWKYVYHTRADAQHGPERELYNLRADPAELRNLAADPQQDVRMKELHAAMVIEIGEDPGQTEKRYRAGAIPEAPMGTLTP